MKRFLVILFLFGASGAVAQDLVGRIDRLVEQYHTDRAFQGTVVAVENGTILYAKGFGDADPGRSLKNGPAVQYRIASISKMFTAAMIMKLVEQGKVSLQDPITRYLTNYRRDTGDRVTIHHLLTHSSGIPEFATAARRRDHANDPMPSLDHMIENYCSDDLAFEPGSRFSYSNSGYILLGAVIQKVTGLTYDQALRSMILEPAGMQHSGLDCNGLTLPMRAVGFERGFGDTLPRVPDWNIDWVGAAGGLYATGEDMAKWDALLYDPSFLSRASVRQMSTAYFPAFRGGQSYGYGTTLSRRVRSRDGDSLLVVFHAGGLPGFNSLYSRVPATRQMVFAVTNASSAPLQAITDGILNIMNGFDPAPVKRSMALELYRAIQRKGVQDGLRAVESERYKAPEAFDLSEPEIDALGRQYLRAGDLDAAQAVLAVNVREFPKSAGACVAMGECIAAAGDGAKAATFYRRAIELDPQNAAAQEALKKLGGH